MRSACATLVLIAALPILGATVAANPLAATVYAPEAAYIDHPLHVAIRSDETLPTSLPYVVLLDNKLLFSARPQPNDAVHTFIFTPPRAGQLSVGLIEVRMTDFVGEPETGDPSNYSASDRLALLPVMQPPPTGFDVRDTHNLSFDWRFDEGASLNLWGVHGPAHDQPLTVLVDVRDGDGRLVRSVVPSYRHAAHLPGAPAPDAGHIRTYVFPAHFSPEPVFTQSDDTTWHSGIGSGPGLTSAPQRPPCEDRVLVDPDPFERGTNTWQEWTTLRFAPRPDTVPERVRYQLWTPGPSLNAAPFGSQAAVDPFKTYTLRPPGPGTHQMLIELDDTECMVTFHVIPNTDNRPGTARILTHVDDNRNATITLEAARDGLVLSGYVFDTRVYRRETPTQPGQLVWAGRLYDDGFPAKMRLYDLAPGTYQVHTYPSPEDLGTPPVATDDPAGFTATFTIPEPPTPEAAPPAETAPAPAAVLPALLATLALLGLARRR